MVTVESLEEIIGDKKLTLTLKFTHAGIVDADYAKLFVMLVHMGVVQLDAKLSDSAPQLSAKVPAKDTDPAAAENPVATTTEAAA